MPIHPLLLSRVFADAVRQGGSPDAVKEVLGPCVLVGHLPTVVTVQPNAATAFQLIPDTPALTAAGLSMEMVCWPLRKRGLDRLLGTSVRIGRDNSSDLVLPGVAVSKIHATLVVEGETALLKDAGSANHTFVNGVQLPPHAPTKLVDGDRVSFAGLEFLFLRTSRLLLLLVGRES